LPARNNENKLRKTNISSHRIPARAARGIHFGIRGYGIHENSVKTARQTALDARVKCGSNFKRGLMKKLVQVK
jgi:hypothetical protein